MLDYSDELEEITRILTGQPYGMTITSIAAASGMGRNRVAKYLDVLTLSGRTGMKNVGNAKVFFLIDRVPVTSMLNLSSDFIIVVNSQLEVIYVSDNLLRTDKLERHKVIGTDISELHLSLLPFPDLRDHIQQALAGEEQVSEYSVPDAGTSRWFRMKMIPTVLEGGIGGVGIILEETTELKSYEMRLEKKIHTDEIRLAATTEDLNPEIEKHRETEIALKKSEQCYRTLVEHAGEGMLLLNRDGGIITFTNQAMATMLGYAPHKIQGRPVLTLTNDAGIQTLQRAQSQLAEGTVEEGEIQLYRRNGAIIHAEFTSTPIYTTDNEEYKWLLLINDVTDQKEKEEAIRFTNTLLNGIIEGSDRMVATLDLNFAFVTSNSAYRNEFEQVFGITPHNGMTLEDALSHRPEDLERIFWLWRRALQGEDFCTVQQFGEEENEYEIRLFPLRDNEGNIFGAANLLCDITSLEKAVTTFQVQDVQLRKFMKQAALLSSQPETVESARL